MTITSIARLAVKGGKQVGKLIKNGKTASNMAEQAVQKMDKGAVADDIYKTVVNSDGSMSKLFSNGSRLRISSYNVEVDGVRRVITERRLYNKDGIEVLSDRKWFDTKQVGNKTVKTKKVNREVSCLNSQASLGSCEINPDSVRIYNYKADRVYQDSKLVGMRETQSELSSKSGIGFHKTAVTKCVADPGKTIQGSNGDTGI